MSISKHHTAHTLSFFSARVFIKFKGYLMGRLLEGGIDAKEIISHCKMLHL